MLLPKDEQTLAWDLFGELYLELQTIVQIVYQFRIHLRANYQSFPLGLDQDLSIHFEQPNYFHNPIVLRVERVDLCGHQDLLLLHLGVCFQKKLGRTSFTRHLESKCTVKEMSYWGYHLVADVGKCIPSSIRCGQNIYQFAKHLVKEIDMVPYGEPQIHHFGSGNKAGYTLVQLIETSNITAHFVEETNDFYLDVFSCKQFDPDVVERSVQQYFSPNTMKKIFLVRQANPLLLENGRREPILELR